MLGDLRRPLLLALMVPRLWIGQQKMVMIIMTPGLYLAREVAPLEGSGAATDEGDPAHNALCESTKLPIKSMAFSLGGYVKMPLLT